jgi:hypothetical protein
MVKLFLLLFVWGPALVGFSIGWVIRHPNDWSGPAVIGPLGALLSFFTYRWGLRRVRTISADLKPHFIAGMIVGAGTGVMVLGMLVLGIIG